MKMSKMKMRVHQQFPILCGAIRRNIQVRKGHETKYEKMHENFYENFDHFLPNSRNYVEKKEKYSS